MSEKSARTLLVSVVGGIAIVTLAAMANIAWASKADKSELVRLEGKIDEIHMAVCFARREVPGCAYKTQPGP